ncbi:hypothetical protein [Cyanobium gracile]|uniref:Uncharacterized protein n=1 Tax=Cyanobium gracile UHCC 0281 TaxID=3110309 RepID=A0ABU5SUF2_9CYAN|nr:hypothetical protein [Cyanobium gracile]MEA5442139.1 hypothetical protein [Cyanobium gracile UHCC 0281]
MCPTTSIAGRARLTFNGITRYGNGATSLIGGNELSFRGMMRGRGANKGQQSY